MPTFDTLTFVGLERSHLRNAVYRRVFGDDAGPVRIGRYSILERIGAGARGVVFKAFDNQLDRLVALKVLSTRAGDHAELIREAKALARLSHPNVLSVYEVGETEEAQVFLATEYVKGWTLRGWFDEEHRSEAAIVDVMRQVALGVQAAHDEGLVHRDLKPANILVGNDGRVRVADFGLARFDPTALEPGSDIARDGFATTTAGTPGYMAPELFEGKPASAASDQYALAVTLGELVPSARGPLAAALRRGLAETPEDRFPSVRGFADALSAQVGRSKRRMLGLGAALVGLGGVSAALLLLPAGQTDAPEAALLEGWAALPSDPALALDALREIAESDDDRALALAEQALALGPEDGRWRLPEGTGYSALLGDLVAYRSESDALVMYALGNGTPRRVTLEQAGLVESHPMVVPGGPPLTGLRLELHDTSTLHGVAPRALKAMDDGLKAIAVSADGRRIARHDDETESISVRDSRSGETVWTIALPGVNVSSVSLDHDGGRVGWTLSAGAAYVHDILTETTIPLEPSAAKIIFPPGGDSVILQGRYTGVFEVRLSDGRVTRLFDEDERFLDVQLSPGGAWLAARDDKGGINVGRLEAWVTQRLDGDGFSFSPDGAHVATYSGREVIVHDLSSEDMRRYTVPVAIEDLEFVSDASFWVLGSDDILRRFTVGDEQVLLGHTTPLADLALSRDGSRAVSIAREFSVRLWDVDAGTSVEIVRPDYSARRLAIDAEHERVAIVSVHGGPTFLYDFEGNLVAELPDSSARPAVDATGVWYGAGKDGVWRHEDGDTTTVGGSDCGSLVVTDTYVAATCGWESATVQIWDGNGHHTQRVTSQSHGTTLHAWPDAEHLAVVGMNPAFLEIGEDGTLARQPTPRALVGAHRFLVPAASSDAHDLIITRTDGTSVLWDGEAPPVRVDDATNTAVLAMSGDGRRYAFGSGRGAIVVRDRPVSKGKRDLAAVLEAHAVVEGEL